MTRLIRKMRIKKRNPEKLKMNYMKNKEN